MDFGAARRIIGGMTRALTTVLKPGYAPIEQYSDDGSMQQGAWTDIYAVGGVLYHAMTGKVPVQAISRMMNDPLKPVAAAARGTYSENLCAVVMKCLAVMPENRYQSVDELRAALGWVTTPVSSTVILQRTTYANAADSAAANLARSAAVAPATPVPSAPLAAAASAAGSVDPLAALIGSPPSAPKPAPAQFATPVALRGSAPATAPAIPESKPAAGAPPAKKSNVLPIAVLAFAALAVVGSAAYLMMSRGDNPG
jgi:serine/threonine protein kinase